MNKFAFMGMLFCSFYLNADEPPKSFYEDRQRGWYWHEEPPIEEEPEEPEAITPAPATEAESVKSKKVRPFSVEHIRESLPVLRDRAIDNPNDENLLAWAVMQRVMLDKSSEFSYRNRNLFLKFPELSEERLMKTSGAALILRDEEIEKNKGDLYARLSEEVSIFYFYRGDCQWCQKQGPLVSMFRDKTGIDALPISFDGLPPTGDFENFRLSNELTPSFLKKLSITQVPATFMVFNDGSEITQLTDGFTTLDALEERLVLLAEDKGIIDQSDLNKIKKAKRVDFVENELQVEETEDPDQVLMDLIRNRFGLSDSEKATEIENTILKERNSADD
ncbi:conjugal transfer protein TraF [Alteromonas gracilis]|uniref:conjugal transfer protein TraF n=1 Tax=Alteromonas gracilis TaxID=1479524 RepID=UPI003734DAD2